MKNKKRYLIVDDDKSNNLICKMILKKVLDDVEVTTYDIPKTALDYISNEYGGSTDEKPTVLFLDINMPDMSGWEFMEFFKNFDENIHRQFTIYILSSSIDSRDKHLAAENPLVKDYITKPLTREIIKDISL